MGTGIQISSVNYNGQIANVTFYPDTGGTVSLGANVLPHTFSMEYYYGVYELYFSVPNTTCYTYLNDPNSNYLLQENYFTLDQEDNSKILIT